MDKPDTIDAVKESDIHDDVDHNLSSNDDDNINDDDSSLDIADEDEAPPVSSHYDANKNEYVEEVVDP